MGGGSCTRHASSPWIFALGDRVTTLHLGSDTEGQHIRSVILFVCTLPPFDVFSTSLQPVGSAPFLCAARPADAPGASGTAVGSESHAGDPEAAGRLEEAAAGSCRAGWGRVGRGEP